MPFLPPNQYDWWLCRCQVRDCLFVRWGHPLRSQLATISGGLPPIHRPGDAVGSLQLGPNLNQQLKSKKKRICSEVSVNSLRNPCRRSWRSKGRLWCEGFAGKEMHRWHVNYSEVTTWHMDCGTVELTEGRKWPFVHSGSEKPLKIWMIHKLLCNLKHNSLQKITVRWQCCHSYDGNGGLCVIVVHV